MLRVHLVWRTDLLEVYNIVPSRTITNRIQDHGSDRGCQGRIMASRTGQGAKCPTRWSSCAL